MRSQLPVDSDEPAQEQLTTRPSLYPWSLSGEDVAAQWKVNPLHGLSHNESVQRLRHYGPNQLRPATQRKWLVILLAQFKSVVVLLLAAAMSVSLLLGDWVEGLAIAVVLLINSAIGFITELRAVRSMEALQHLGRVETRVRRNGELLLAPAESLAPGDIVVLEAGDVITADMRLLTAAKLQADESTLTGESVPVSKQIGVLPTATHLSDRTNSLFKGTVLTRGAGEAVVTATGATTELGHIAHLVATAEAEQTPLEKRLTRLGHKLVWATLVITVLVAVVGVLMGREAVLAVEVAIALAVAAIPEGLPIVATLALARGMWRMARHNALVARLSAVETLGATSVILTDKTGTLTENRMAVRRMEMLSGSVEITGDADSLSGQVRMDGSPLSNTVTQVVHEAMMVAVLCNNAEIHFDVNNENHSVGDPTELALLFAAARLDIQRNALLQQFPELREEPFAAERKMMATFHQSDTRILVAVKGAPEAVLEHCARMVSIHGAEKLDPSKREEWRQRAERLASSGLRTLALARKYVDDLNAEPYADLELLAILGLHDPPRTGVREAIADCHDAGIRVVMVTGDHLATALNIATGLGIGADADERQSSAGLNARELGDISTLDMHAQADLLGAHVIARASPKQKLDLIELHQSHGDIVAMTGDGVNDAPALKKADIGVAMGQRGTQVAKEAAAMVLEDDEFSTIVTAVAMGRAIYANLRKFVIYLMSCNLSEILVVSLATLAGGPLPLLPLQILFLNLVTDVFPALALGMGEGHASLMKQAPRPAAEDLITRRHWILIVVYGVLMAFVVLLAMMLAIHVLELNDREAVTVSFLTLALAQLWHVFNMRERPGDWRRNEISGNIWIWYALVLCVGLLLAAVYWPVLGKVLQLSRPSAQVWLLILTMSLMPLMLGGITRKWVGLALRKAGR